MRDITVTKGIGGKAVAGIAAMVLAGGIGGGMGLMSLLSGQPPVPVKQSIQPPAVSPPVIRETKTKTVIEGFDIGLEVIPPKK